MASEWRSKPARYGLALAIFAVIVAVALLFIKFSIQLNIMLLVGTGLVAAAWYAGRGPGFLLVGLVMVLAMVTNGVPKGVPLAAVILTYATFASMYVALVWLVSGRRIAERRLKEQRETLRITLASIGDGVIATNEQGDI